MVIDTVFFRARTRSRASLGSQSDLRLWFVLGLEFAWDYSQSYG